MPREGFRLLAVARRPYPAAHPRLSVDT